MPSFPYLVVMASMVDMTRVVMSNTDRTRPTESADGLSQRDRRWLAIGGIVFLVELTAAVAVLAVLM